MLDGIKSLLNSEKALAAGALILAATALVIFNKMTVGEWQSFAEVIFLGYVSGKTVQGAVATWADAKKSPEVRIEAKTEARSEVKTEEHDATR